MNQRTDETRRDFLRRMAAAGFVTLGSGALIACGGGEGGDGAGDASSDGGGDAVALNCSDPSQVTDVEQQQREALQYVEVSETEGQVCTNCSQWQAPEAEGSCGTCKVVPGPINPAGHCSVWVAAEGA